MYELAKHPFTVIHEKCAITDERREAVKGHTDST